MTTIPRISALVALLALVLTACPEDPAVELDPADDPAAEADPQQDEPADVPDEEGSAETDAAGATVAVATTGLGDVLVDGDGLTLYMFEPDAQGDPTCYDDCAAAWPPLLTDAEPAAGEGADGGLLGTAERDEGTTQVTYDGWPLYYWAGDEAPGDTNGQGVNDVWWVLTADGKPVRDAAGAEEEGTGSLYGS